MESGDRAPEPGGRDYVSGLSRGFARIATWSYDHRGWVALLCLGALALCIHLAGQARIDNSYEAFFDLDDPAYRAYLQYREDFGSDEVSYVLYEAPDQEHGPWNLEVMGKIAQLTRALEDEVPFIYEVTSLANAELTEGVAGGIEIRKLRDEFPRTQQELLDWRARFLAKPMYVGNLLSADGRYAALSIEMDRTSTDPIEAIRLDPRGGDGLDNLYPQVTHEKIEEILARPEYAGIRFHHSGDVPLNAVYNRVIETETGTLVMISGAVIAALLGLFFRSVLGVVGPLAVALLSIAATVAFIALAGWKLDMLFSSAPNLLITVGVAYSVHIVSEFQAFHAELGDRREALRRTFYLVGTPCLLCALTTAVGFASLGVAPIKAIAHMGLYSAAGVLAAFVLSITLLCVLLSFAPAPRVRAEQERTRARGGRWVGSALAAVARFDLRHWRAILVGWVVVGAVITAGIARLRVDSNWLADYGDRVPVKQATRFIDEVMGGMSNLVYLFDTGAPDGILEPGALREIERVELAAARSDYLVKKTHSIVDILKDLNQAFHEGDPAYYTLPESRELIAQYLLLYESSGGEEVEEWVSSDFSRANLELRLRVADTSLTAQLVDEIDARLADQPLQVTQASLTGIGALWLKLLDYITSSQINGFGLAFLVITPLMCLMFRSLRIGLLAMIPNVAPILLTLGAMGWLGIPLDYNKLLIASVALGIAVDDTVHVLARYHHEFRQRGDYAAALIPAMLDVGRALVVTSVALVLGFLVFSFSLLDAKVAFGALLASTIAIALTADLLMTPALVLALKPFGPPRATSSALRDAA
jgi:predicted RND superfamily exporter protein